MKTWIVKLTANNVVNREYKLTAESKDEALEEAGYLWHEEFGPFSNPGIVSVEER
jgi:hypothetical protein